MFLCIVDNERGVCNQIYIFAYCYYYYYWSLFLGPGIMVDDRFLIPWRGGRSNYSIPYLIA